MSIGRASIERYLNGRAGPDVKLTGITPLGESREENDAKGFGYGTPLRLDYVTGGGERQRAVLHTIAAGPFGHEHMADRAQILLWQYSAFNSLPRHIHALDVAALGTDGAITSIGKTGELCLLTEFAEGTLYAADLHRIRETGAATSLDFARADALADYLAGIHREPVDDHGLYTRRIRELVGHGECIMGIADSYPEHSLMTRAVLEEIEHLAVSWRWRLRDRGHRLRRVHGDFHPWNILFGNGCDFKLLDRSRGEFGDPADDVTSLTLNFLFFSLQRSGRLEGAFADLFLSFWDRYLAATGDRELLAAAAPFLAFRGLVMASPVWYPDLAGNVREKLLAFILAVLKRDCFDPREVNEYCGC